MHNPTTQSVSDISVITVSYNAPQLINTLLKTLRQHYSNKVYVIDGSEKPKYEEIKLICDEFDAVELIHFDYNIHHGPGMAWAFKNLPITGKVLVIDSDVIIVNPGFLESMNESLTSDMYGVGYVGRINEEGFDLDDNSDIGIPYLHPACMLCNIDVVRRWPLPVKHGAPMTPTMIAIHNAKQNELLGRIDWLHKDFRSVPPINYLIHDWQGTVKTVNSYSLDDWMELAKKRKLFVDVIASNIPENARTIVEIGEADGLLARTLKEKRDLVSYVALQNTKAIQLHNKVTCNEVRQEDLDNSSAHALDGLDSTDCWILDKAIEHLRNPLVLLKQIREKIKPDAQLIVVVPNLLNWNLIESLCKAVVTQSDEIVKAIKTNNMTLSHAIRLLGDAGFSLERGLQINLNGEPSTELLNHISFISGAEKNTSGMRSTLMTENYILIATPTKAKSEHH